MAVSKETTSATPSAGNCGPTDLTGHNPAAQGESNQAAIKWLEEWRSQPPVEGEMSWEAFEKLMQENGLSYGKRSGRG